MFNIGILAQPWSKVVGIYCQIKLRENYEVETNLVYFSNHEEKISALLSGQIHIIPAALRELPTKLPLGVVISALSERLDQGNSLLISKKNIDESKPLNAALGLRIGVISPINKAQLQLIRPDFNIEVFESANPITLFDKLRDEQLDGMIVSGISAHVVGINTEDYPSTPINPREMLVEPGQGFVAFLTAEDDLPTRRYLKKLHSPESTPITNTERRLKQLFDGSAPLAAYCYRDVAGYYHLQAAAVIEGELRTRRVSQSTVFELAERCHTLLMQQNAD